MPVIIDPDSRKPVKLYACATKAQYWAWMFLAGLAGACVVRMWNYDDPLAMLVCVLCSVGCLFGSLDEPPGRK